MSDNKEKNFALAAFSAIGGCVLLLACLFGISTGAVDLRGRIRRERVRWQNRTIDSRHGRRGGERNGLLPASLIPFPLVRLLSHRGADADRRPAVSSRPASRYAVSTSPSIRYGWRGDRAIVVPCRSAARPPYRPAAFRPSSRRMAIRQAGRAGACVCVDVMDCLIYTYNLPAACYSIDVEREQTKGHRNEEH